MKNLYLCFLFLFIFNCSVAQDYFNDYKTALSEAKASQRKIVSADFNNDFVDVNLDAYRQFLINHLIVYPDFFKHYVLQINSKNISSSKKDSMVWYGVTIADTTGKIEDSFRYKFNKNRIQIRFQNKESASNQDLIRQLDMSLKDEKKLNYFIENYNVKKADSTFIYDYIKLLIEKNVFTRNYFYLIDDLVALFHQRPADNKPYNVFYNQKDAFYEAERSHRNVLALVSKKKNEISQYHQILAEQLTIKLLKNKEFFKENVLYIGEELGLSQKKTKQIEESLYYITGCCTILDKKPVYLFIDVKDSTDEFIYSIDTYLEKFLFKKIYIHDFEQKYNDNKTDVSFLVQYIDAVNTRSLPAFQYAFLFDAYFEQTNGYIQHYEAVKLLVGLAHSENMKFIVDKEKKKYYKKKQNLKYSKIYFDRYNDIEPLQIKYLQSDVFAEVKDTNFEIRLFNHKFLDFLRQISDKNWRKKETYNDLGVKMFGEDYTLILSYYTIFEEDLDCNQKKILIKNIVNYKNNPLFLSFLFPFNLGRMIQEYLGCCQSNDDFSEAATFIQGLKNNETFFNRATVKYPITELEMDELLAYSLYFAGKESDAVDLILKTKENMRSQNIIYNSPVQTWIDYKHFHKQNLYCKTSTLADKLIEKFLKSLEIKQY